jgi:hypothetical protein
VRLGVPSAHVQSHFTDEQLGHYHIDAIDALQIHSGDALHFQRIRDSRCVTATLINYDRWLRGSSSKRPKM